MSYAIPLATLACIYLMLALTLNLAAGYGGMLSLCHAAFFGIGAYTTALLMVNAGWGFFPSLGAAVVVCGMLSLIIGIPALRLRGDYFILGTLALQAIIVSVMHNWAELTGGPHGVPGIPRPELLGQTLSAPIALFGLSAGLALLMAIVLRNLQASPFGRTLRLIRDDPIAAGALGKPVWRYRIMAFAISAGLAAIPGALFAVHMRYIDPSSFTLTESIFVLSIVIVGGAGSTLGPWLGAFVLVLLPEGLRFVPHLPDAAAANLRQVFYGALLASMMYWRPSGLAGEYDLD